MARRAERETARSARGETGRVGVFTQLDAIPNDLCRKRTDTCVNTRATTG